MSAKQKPSGGLLRAVLITLCSWALAFGVTWAVVTGLGDGLR
jgi:hypothetical protein